MRTLDTIFENKPFVVIVSLPRNDVELACAAFDHGIDAIKVHTNVHHRASGTYFGTWTEERPIIEKILAFSKGPVGILPGGETTMTPAEMNQAISCGIDFFDIYDFHMPSWMFDLPIGKMVAVGQGYTLDDVRALDHLGMDYLEASIIPGNAYRQTLVAKDLESYSLLSAATSKPVLVPSQKALRPEDLCMLSRIGIRGVVLGTIAIGDTPQEFLNRLPAFIRAVP